MENLNEQTTVTAQPAEAEEVKGVAENSGVSLGKFKDVNALLNAYNSLQAEFTKRCQRLKELEASALPDKPTGATGVGAGLRSQSQGTTLTEDKEFLKEYLKGVMESKQTAVIMDGVGTGVSSPVKRPSTIAEAGMLAREILK